VPEAVSLRAELVADLPESPVARGGQLQDDGSAPLRMKLSADEASPFSSIEELGHVLFAS